MFIQACIKSIPKKSKVKVRALTQDELIARALDMEEGNIVEHRNYLFVEEEKRKKAHAVRIAISGPLLRWVSRRETLSVPSEAQLTGMFRARIPGPYVHLDYEMAKTVPQTQHQVIQKRSWMFNNLQPVQTRNPETLQASFTRRMLRKTTLSTRSPRKSQRHAPHGRILWQRCLVLM